MPDRDTIIGVWFMLTALCGGYLLLNERPDHAVRFWYARTRAAHPTGGNYDVLRRPDGREYVEPWRDDLTRNRPLTRLGNTWFVGGDRYLGTFRARLSDKYGNPVYAPTLSGWTS